VTSASITINGFVVNVGSSFYSEHLVTDKSVYGAGGGQFLSSGYADPTSGSGLYNRIQSSDPSAPSVTSVSGLFPAFTGPFDLENAGGFVFGGDSLTLVNSSVSISAAAVPGPTVGAGGSSFALAALFLGWLMRRRGTQAASEGFN
jgi:hypothetical protein